MSSAVTSCPPVLGTFASDQNITFSPFNAPHAPIQPSHGSNVPESSHLIYNYPCQQHERQQVKENTPPTYPQRPKPTPGIFVFARHAFLDSKVTRCYGCGYSLKPDGTIPDPPDDLVLTTRLHRQYYKAGQQQGSPDISKVYYHVNPFCIRVTFPSFEPNLCRIPSSPRTQKDDRTKACCEVLVGLWSVTIMSPYHVPTISKHQTLKTKTFFIVIDDVEL